MRKGNNIRLRADGRYEARYEKSRNESGKIIYGYCYGQTYEEAEEKRDCMLARQYNEKRMNLLILGAGSHGEEVYEIARAVRIFEKISFLDDRKVGADIIGKCSDAADWVFEYPMAIAAVGDKLIRRKMHKELNDIGFIIPSIIHPSAIISTRTNIGPGSVICASAIVDYGAKIGRGCIISSGATVGRDAELADWSFLNNGEVIVKSREK